MLKMFFSLIMFNLTSMMFFLTHPLSMGLMILSQTLLICLISGLMIKTYWFSYILFLIFLGGLLILFIYVSSIASNEMFNFSIYMKSYFIIFIIISLFISFIFMFNLNWMNFFFNSDMNNFLNFYLFFNNENKINLTKLYNTQTFMLMFMLIIYLFITLVAVVKITNIFFGPLRSMN